MMHQLVDKFIICLVRITEDVLFLIDQFIFLKEFVVLDIKEDDEVC